MSYIFWTLCDSLYVAVDHMYLIDFFMDLSHFCCSVQSCMCESESNFGLQNGDLCISILHPPVDDPQSGELPCERWNPTQNVRYFDVQVFLLY